MKDPLVSICIPAYQAELHLKSTLRRALSQSGIDFEVVVLDNASTDRTAAILAEHEHPRLRVERNEHVLPVAENWNRAVSLSRGRFVKVLCADDLIRSDAIAAQAKILLELPQAALVASRRHLIDESGAIMVVNAGLRGLLGLRESRSAIRAIIRNGGNPIGEPGNTLFRRRDFDTAGGFDSAPGFPMDLDLWIRLLRRGDLYGQPESLAAFRIGTGTISASAATQQYLEQRALTRRVGADPHWQVTWGDRAVSALRAPAARLRRETLFKLGRWATRAGSGAGQPVTKA